MYWIPDKLLRILLFWTSLTTLVFWLPLIRGAFDGASYHWALAPTISGSGMQGSFWVLVVGSSFALIVVFLGWRGARSAFRWLLLAWHSFLGIGSLYLTATQAETFVFRGDTLGISFSLAWVAPLTCGVLQSRLCIGCGEIQMMKDGDLYAPGDGRTHYGSWRWVCCYRCSSFYFVWANQIARWIKSV